MEIEEWRPPPPRPAPPQPVRKKRPVLVLALLMVISFLATVAFLCWPFLTRPTVEVATSVGALTVVQSVTSAQPTNMPPARKLSAQVVQNITGISGCISRSALSSDDREQLMAILLAKARSIEPVILAAFESGSIDFQRVTIVQVSGFMNMLNHIQGPLGNAAQQGFQQGMQDGTCKIAPPPVFTLGYARPPTS